MSRLFTLVENHYQEMSFRLHTLERHESEQTDDYSVLEHDAISTVPIVTEDSDAMGSILKTSGTRNFDFTEDLQNSWVYKRNCAFRESGLSFLTRSMFASRWSCLSALSMADLSNISVFNLPVTENEVFNVHRSSQTWSNEHSDPIRPLQSLVSYRYFPGAEIYTSDDTLHICTSCDGKTRGKGVELGRCS